MQKSREKRLAVNLLCRMRHDDGWYDVRIRNVSSRGLGATSITPPAAGQYIEVRRGPAVVVARVVWRQGSYFGLRAQDSIDVPNFIEQRGGRDDGHVQQRDFERRKSPREPIAISTAERSRRASSMLQYSALVVAALAAALIVSNAARQILAAPLTATLRAMSGSATDRR